LKNWLKNIIKLKLGNLKLKLNFTILLILLLTHNNLGINNQELLKSNFDFNSIYIYISEWLSKDDNNIFKKLY